MSAPPRTRFLLPFTIHILNPVTRRVAGRLPGFAIVIHVGRTSGREYRTPVNVFRRGPDYVFALTYGPDVQWVKNVLAAGGCWVRVNGRTVKLTDPRKFSDPKRTLMPLPVRLFLGFMRVNEFLTMRTLIHPGATIEEAWFHFAPVGGRDANGCRVRCATSAHGADGWPQARGGPA